jgi:RHS repeat-associated protein
MVQTAGRWETLIGSVVLDPDLYYWDAAGPETSMDAYDFPGFVLTTLDGTTYTIKRDDLGDHPMDNLERGPFIQAYGKAHLSQITTRNTNVTTINLNSIVTTSPTGATNQITFQRNTAGLIKSISDPISIASNGPPAMIYQYDPLNNLIAVERLVDRSGSGKYVTNSTFTYMNVNFPHYVTGIINADGTQVAANFYDDSGKLTAVQDANGNKTLFVHNPTNDMEVIIDRNKNANTYVYDLRGNVTAQTNQVGQITTMAYDANNNKTNEVMYLNGAPYSTNSYIYDTNNLLLISIDPLNYGTTNTYDRYGDMLTIVDALGYGTTNAYDSNGNLIATTNALGNTTLNTYSGGLLLGSVDSVGTLTTNAYDGNNNLIGIATIDSSGVVSSNSFTYDQNNNQVTSTVWRRVAGVWTAATTTNIYDAENRVIQTVHPNGGTNTTIYNANGRQQATIDALGRTNSFGYNSQGRLIYTTNADGTTTQSIYDNNGNRTESVDQLGRVTTYMYDALNRVSSTIYADNTTNKTVHDGVGRVAQSIDARGAITAYDFDPAGRQLAVTNAAGTGASMVSRYIYDADGNQTIVTDANSHSTTNVYDALNRQVQTLYADGTTTSTGFDAAGRKVAQTNQDGIVTLFGYDGTGRLISVTNALNKPEQMVTRYQYDEAGNEVAQIDALNRTNYFTNDGMGRRILHTRPDGQFEGFTYDPVGNLAYQTYVVGNIVTNGYDSMNRLINRGQVGMGHLSGYAYTATGQRLTATNYAGGTSDQFDLNYVYDSRDRLVRKTTRWIGGEGIGGGSLAVSLSYGYDANGNLTNMASSMANGVNLTYSYDPLNRITNVLSHEQLAASYTFDAVGNLQGMKYGNGLTNVYQYDSLNRLTNLVWKFNSAAVASFYYQLGKTGNRTNLGENVNGVVRTNSWQYDNLYRLTNETIGGVTFSNVQYQFDQVGNRTHRLSTIAVLTNAIYQYNTNDWLTTDGYDNPPGSDSNPSNGNTTQSGTHAYQYNVLNQMLNADYPTKQMAYDPDGNRYVKTADGGNTWTFYLVDDRNPTGYPQVVEEYQSSGISFVYLKRSYNYGLSLISQQQYNTNTLLPSALSYYSQDGHGSVRILTDTNGTVSDSYVYDAYGTLLRHSANVNNTAPNDYLYAGEQFDSDLELYYLRARYYNTDTGRFWTADSFQGEESEPASLNKYLFCEDDTIDNIDKSGHDIGEVLAIIDIGEFFAQISNASATKAGATVVNQRAVSVHIDVSSQNMMSSFQASVVENMLENQLSAALKVNRIPGQSLHIKIRIGGTGLKGKFGWMGLNNTAYFHLVKWDPNLGVSGYTLPGTTTTTLGTTKIQQDMQQAGFNSLGNQYWVNVMAHEVIFHGAANLSDPLTGGQVGEIGSRTPFGSQPFTINTSDAKKINNAFGFE